MDKFFSYHIFYFPFKWSLKGNESAVFEHQTDLSKVQIDTFSNWQNISKPLVAKEEEEFYNEKNYFYEFVHPVLYDTGKPDGIIKHFERKETQQQGREVLYKISVKGSKTYTLKVDAINLNLYTMGVGVLSFFLKNDREDQKEPEDILRINQFGRRLFPPFLKDLDFRGEIAEYISIEGLNGSPSLYYEDFSGYKDHEQSWLPACFVTNLIKDLCSDLSAEPVIDDRMFVNCWYGNDELSGKVSKSLNIANDEKLDFTDMDDFWYKYVYVDVKDITCQDAEMRKELICNQTYKRWKNYGTVYGFSRYSFVLLSDTGSFNKTVTAVHMRTMYSRMVELILIQRASTLCFSDEVIRVSRLSKRHKYDKTIVNQISSLYQEYIRFINQVHFREVTAQDQGIELYNLMSKTLKIEDYVRNLDKEIEEFYQYVNLLDDKTRNRNIERLNIIAAIFLPATLVIGVFSIGGKELPDWFNLPYKLITILVATTVMYGLIQLIKKNR